MTAWARRLWITGIVGVVTLFAGVSVSLTEAALRIPTIRRSVTVPVGAREVFVTASDGAVLRGAMFQSTQPNGKAVMILHGLGDTRHGTSAFASMFVDHGFTVLVPDSRAHGASGGDLVTYGLREREDVRAWADFLGPAKLYGLGESLGAAILIQAARGEPRLRAIVAECSYATFRDAARERVPRLVPWLGFASDAIIGVAFTYARWRYGIDFEHASPVEAIRQSRTPTLLIHGLADERTAPWQSRRLHEANPDSTVLWEVPGAGHTKASLVAGEEFRRRVLEWFEK